jgi:pyrroline-5-carboxylate reductase
VKIGFIGAGTMGQALIKGLVARGVPRRRILAADASAGRRREVSRRFRIRTSADNAGVAGRSDIVILAVKPQQMPEVASELAAALPRRALVISIAAGITLRWLQQRLPGRPVIRVMPNLPATVGYGFAAIAPGRGVRARHRAQAAALFGAVGVAAPLPERHFDAVTAVSGSGPAYVCYFVQAWEAAARALGLPEPAASAAIRQTLRGSACLLESGGASAAELIRRVASKKGTTEAALKVLARRRVAAHFIEALRAAERRSKALSS